MLRLLEVRPEMLGTKHGFLDYDGNTYVAAITRRVTTLASDSRPNSVGIRRRHPTCSCLNPLLDRISSPVPDR